MTNKIIRTNPRYRGFYIRKTRKSEGACGFIVTRGDDTAGPFRNDNAARKEIDRFLRQSGR